MSGSFLMTISGCVEDVGLKMMLFKNGFFNWNVNFLRSGDEMADLELMLPSTALHMVFMESQAKALLT